MSKVKEAVDSLLGEVAKRDAKIQEKINGLQKDAAEVKNSIDGLMHELVNYDLADDEQGQAASNKKISKQRSILDDIQERIKAYKNVLNDPEIIKSQLPIIINIARQEQENRRKVMKQKTDQKLQLEADIKNLKQRLESLTAEINSLTGSPEANDLIPLLKYIEARPIKRDSERRYLSAYLNGVTGELLEQYIEVPIDYRPSAKNVGAGPSINWCNSGFTRI